MQILQMKVSGQDFNLFVIDCSQISCGKSLRAKKKIAINVFVFKCNTMFTQKIKTKTQLLRHEMCKLVFVGEPVS